MDVENLGSVVHRFSLFSRFEFEEGRTPWTATRRATPPSCARSGYAIHLGSFRNNRARGCSRQCSANLGPAVTTRNRRPTIVASSGHPLYSKPAGLSFTADGVCSSAAR